MTDLTPAPARRGASLPAPARRTLNAALRWGLKHAQFGSGRLLRVDFPPTASPEPRWGHGKPRHVRLAQLLSGLDDEYEGVLREFAAYADALHAIPLAQTDAREPHWGNGFLFGVDGASLYCFTRERAPRRYIEVGSGNSTLFVDRARRDGRLDTEIVSIDPRPRREIDAICDRVVREPIETADLDVFSDLEAGDIVFLDGTHRVFTNSDAVVFFLDVLPNLPPGVLVGIHDVHLPDDYRPEHTGRYYSEQYLLAAYLLGEPDWMRAVLPCWYVSDHPRLGDLARALVPPAVRTRGVIFWLRTELRGPHA
jgi:predicted O-methyltransferase YrrM